jgi:GTP-binding protein
LNNENQPFKANIETQVKFAIEEANLVLFIVSNKDGIDAKDYYTAKIIKKYKGKKVILVVNKSENQNSENEKLFYSLGFGKPNYVSAEHGVGIGDLLDDVIKFKPSLVEEKKEEHTSFCIIGRTNVGKSTLMNSILHKERVVASPIEHTTRDSIDEDFYYEKELFTIIDTAGIRRKGRVTDNIEK